jgi:hypothetical protein
MFKIITGRQMLGQPSAVEFMTLLTSFIHTLVVIVQFLGLLDAMVPKFSVSHIIDI